MYRARRVLSLPSKPLFRIVTTRRTRPSSITPLAISTSLAKIYAPKGANAVHATMYARVGPEDVANVYWDRHTQS
ncbi:hypothetical protein COCC4DRAFT_35024 [Bipolaris maydis ATCC 48331]|uniref:Uncharacterized protein n=2 Tax=Cochliobolus heterostrophus TaxID=5016 RepID=M2TGK2_COCH5|nr:uncharacterized protein COCC4DRAFT_35024 [Bipolaris maydis ATCC 48331]EMD85629.1 hypothetical protein COCHEDRAFT_1024295 [Bipolaris maydis C5]KAJ5028950.1 hypothetical protein J3E73DRAFT_293653 [Bipolaris maydis]ENH99061.1 hypothetical protein COCC4DRAFT_35024 [Bipolaris maydis ATCC 48331]KAJ6273119.1 hypothetical protein PSV08DRAFT_284775 [Bipolaris maydis]KAJ6280869.1 hypothetical protein J3E71DRAFT_295949 [Bipolaris maydis]